MEDELFNLGDFAIFIFNYPYTKEAKEKFMH